MAASRLHPVVEWIVAGDLNKYAATSSTPTPEELHIAYMYAVENDCVVRLCWTACDGYAGPHYVEIHAGTDMAALEEKLAHIMYGV